jgi:hypothetical protein
MINEHIIKLGGRANSPKKLELSKSYQLLIDNAEVRKIEEVPTDGEGNNLIYHLKISELSNVNLSDGKEIIKTKIKGSPSQRFRNALYHEMASDNFEEDYNQLINNLIINITEVVNKYGKQYDK